MENQKQPQIIPEQPKKAKEEQKEKDTSIIAKELETKEKLANEYISHLQRLQAEFENYQKRTEKEKKSVINFANKQLIVKLLNIKDDFERALSIKNKDEKFTQGVSMIFNSFKKLLEEEGLEEIKAKGLQFDPYKHEVLLQEESDLPENHVVDELQKGYALKGEVIRPAKVKVSKKKQSKE